MEFRHTRPQHPPNQTTGENWNDESRELFPPNQCASRLTGGGAPSYPVGSEEADRVSSVAPWRPSAPAVRRISRPSSSSSTSRPLRSPPPPVPAARLETDGWRCPCASSERGGGEGPGYWGGGAVCASVSRFFCFLADMTIYFCMGLSFQIKVFPHLVFLILPFSFFSTPVS